MAHRVPQLLDEVVALYRAGGRPLASLSDRKLDARFVDAVEAYIGDPGNPALFRAVNGIAAEYVLRRRDAPVLRVVRLKEGPEAAANQPHKPKLCAFIFSSLPEGQDLPMVVLAFGRFRGHPGRRRHCSSRGKRSGYEGGQGRGGPRIPLAARLVRAPWWPFSCW
jgi:hypothetical protein